MRWDWNSQTSDFDCILLHPLALGGAAYNSMEGGGASPSFFWVLYGLQCVE